VTRPFAPLTVDTSVEVLRWWADTYESKRAEALVRVGELAGLAEEYRSANTSGVTDTGAGLIDDLARAITALVGDYDRLASALRTAARELDDLEDRADRERLTTSLWEPGSGAYVEAQAGLNLAAEERSILARLASEIDACSAGGGPVFDHAGVSGALSLVGEFVPIAELGPGVLAYQADLADGQAATELLGVLVDAGVDPEQAAMLADGWGNDQPVIDVVLADPAAAEVLVALFGGGAEAGLAAGLATSTDTEFVARVLNRASETGESVEGVLDEFWHTLLVLGLDPGSAAAAMWDSVNDPSWVADRFGVELSTQARDYWDTYGSDPNDLFPIPPRIDWVDELGLDAAAPLLASSEEAAVAFYNTLGVDDSARLVQLYHDGHYLTFEHLGDALGMAAGSGDLDFGGAEYMQAGAVQVPGRNSEVSPAQLLAISDEIPDEFLAEATAQVFRQSYAADQLVYHYDLPLGGYDPAPSDEYQRMIDLLPDGIGVTTDELGRTVTGHQLATMGEGPWSDDRPDSVGTPAGGEGDDIGLVLFQQLASRGPGPMMDLLRDLDHTGDIDTLVRREHLGSTPDSWDVQLSDIIDPKYLPEGEKLIGAEDQITATFMQLNNPDYTGSQAISDEAAIILLQGAGQTPEPLPTHIARAVDFTLATHPTAMSQREFVEGSNLDHAGLSATAVGTALDGEMVDNALDGVFRAGEGDLLAVTRDSLLPLQMDMWLEAGLNPAEIEAGYLGEIDGRISRAEAAANVERGAITDARNNEIRAVAGTALELTAAGLTGGAAAPAAAVVTDAFIDQAVGRALDKVTWLPTDNQLQAATEVAAVEEDEEEVWRYKMALTIAERGQLALAPDGEPVELVDPNDVFDYLFADVGAHWPESMVVLPSPMEGDELALGSAETGDGQWATLDDWSAVFADYVYEQDKFDDLHGPDTAEEFDDR
jgi:hypothetical protein